MALLTGGQIGIHTYLSIAPSKLAQLFEVAGFSGARIGLTANVDSSLSLSINPLG
ncbi:MAG: hypothetical protein V7629_19640 [Motiliproteus sp.]